MGLLRLGFGKKVMLVSHSLGGFYNTLYASRNPEKVRAIVFVALQIFALNVVLHPESANAYDSLGDGYAKAGNKELAIKNYRKALD